MRYIKSAVLGLLLTVFAHCICYGKATFKPSVIEAAKRSVVAVDRCAALTAYTAPQELHSNGVVIDKEVGYILTSGLAVGPVIVADYTIGFFNGIEAPAKLIYYDTWADFAVLQIDPSVFPQEVQAVKLSNKDPLLGQAVFTIAKGKNKQAIYYPGSVDDTNYSLRWTMPQHFIRVSVPSRSSATGSLIFNKAGEGIALNCAGSDTTDVGLHLSYVHHALSALKQKKQPVRKHIGVLLTTYALDEAVCYDHLPEASRKAYCTKFPNAKNKILQVEGILKGTPADHRLLPGDLIWVINGQLVGPNLVDFDRAMDKAPKDQLLLTIFRHGAFHEVAIPFYSLHNHRVTKIVQFGGTTFFETDDLCSVLGGVPPKTLVACIAAPDAIFRVECLQRDYFNILGMQFLAINGQPVQTLDALIALIPQLVHQKYFTVEYIQHVSFYRELFVSLAHNRCKVNVAYDPNLAPPKVWEWGPIHLEWKGQAIVLQ